jgi:hypothetical protein
MTVYDIVEIQREEPFRALSQLRVLAIALAIVHQRSEVTEHELELCRRVVLSSMPYDRSLILALFQNPAYLTQNHAGDTEKEKGPELPEDHSKDSTERVQTGPAIWRNKHHDTPIVITGDAGIGVDGRRYVSIEGFSTFIPLDEIVYLPVEPKASEEREVFEI